MGIGDNFASWLCTHPEICEISRHLVNESFAEYGAVSSRISKINADGSLTFIAEFGHSEVLLDKTFSAEEWHTWSGDAAKLALGIESGHWDPERKLVVTVLIDYGTVHGFVVVDFKERVEDPAKVLQQLRSLSYPLSLYLVGERIIGGRIKESVAPVSQTLINVEDGEQIRKQLSDRQVKVLLSVSKGMTNNEIAKQLGYSVSTIRHDVMHLFRVLRISARHEAGKIASDLGII